MKVKLGKNTKNSKKFKFVIAIDGPAASGKSTTAKLVAQRLGYLHIDTGAMYRAITLKLLRQHIDLNDEEAVEKVIKDTDIRIVQTGTDYTVLLDNQDVTKEIRLPEVTRSVSRVSSLKIVRELMVREQRKMAVEGGVVLEGRDIGTVVVPDADLKIFMVADVKERAIRRQKDLNASGVSMTLDQLEEEIRIRDILDSTRAISPLMQAHDAVIIDTTNLSIEEQVNLIVQHAENILKQRSN